MNRAPSDRAAVPERSEGYIPLLVPLSLLLVGCMTDPEPKTRVISCGTLTAQDTLYGDPWPPNPPIDTFTVVGGECRRVTE